MIGSRSRNMSFGTLFDFTPLNSKQKAHLSRVYGTLGLSCLITAATISYNLQMPQFLAYILFMASFSYIFYLSRGKDLSGKRLLALVVLSVSEGSMIKDIVHYARIVNPEIVTSALALSLAIFFCFSFCALMATRRLAYYFYSLVSSLISIISIASFCNIFMRSKLVFDATMLGGLLMYAGFVAVDTQITLAEFNMGNQDFVLHAISLYVDIIAIFVRILQIFIEKNDDKKNKNKKNY